MKMNLLFGKTLASLERSLNLRSANQKLIVSNVANLDTPNYKAFKMMVNEAMHGSADQPAQIKMIRTQSRHMAASALSTDTARLERVENNALSLRGDGNTVELDTEMANLAENTLMYNTAARIISNKFKLLRETIKGGQ